jgi:alkanesulfonate monooxygenase SsuD/methylene tetrahydromethanopterin reductase-like flavin-dependent oxidoreductase (luciferase family)
MLSFGVTVLPDPPFSRLLELTQLAEQNGFEYGWTYDSHILWQESYATLPLVADRTERIKLGHFVTNPGIRDPTITASWYATMQDLSNGRMVMGIGRGDSSRRVVGLKPVKVAEFERRCRMIKDLMNGRAVQWNDKELELKWARSELPEIPMWVAGYGPKALGVAGRVGDGVIIQLADPVIISGSWTRHVARRRKPAATRASLSASSARRATSPTTSRTHASSHAGSRRWSRTMSWT